MMAIVALVRAYKNCSTGIGALLFPVQVANACRSGCQPKRGMPSSSSIGRNFSQSWPRVNLMSKPDSISTAVYNRVMARRVIHISDAEAASDFASLLDRVRAGAEVVIEHDAQPVAVVHPAEPVRRTISHCIALLPEYSTATIDPDFAKDVEVAIEGHREPLNPPAWD